MPDENGTEATRSDAPSVDESLFGEAADDAAASADEQDTNEETAQEPEGIDDGEGQAVGDDTGSSEDLKVVVSIKDGRATIGVQQPSSDPYIESFEDYYNLSGLAQETLAVVERARAKWEEEPKYPAHERPALPAKRRNRREQGAAHAGTAEGEAEQQQPETLRLF